MYNYEESVKLDVSTWVLYNVNMEDWKDNREGLEEYLNDTLWTEDSVTGNASGSYYCNTWKAEESLSHNWDLMAEAAECFGLEVVDLSKGAEYWDVTVRCYLLGEAIAEVLDDYEESGAFETEPETEEQETEVQSA